MYFQLKRRGSARVLRAAFTLKAFGKLPLRTRRAGANGTKTHLGARAILRVSFTVR
jgi:hypothetical protein